jgi:hypothetical protein
VVLDSLNALHHSESSVQRCGATILLIMGGHGTSKSVVIVPDLLTVISPSSEYAIPDLHNTRRHPVFHGRYFRTRS